MDFNKLENVDYSFSDYPVLIEYEHLSSYPDFRALNHWHDDFEFTYVFAGRMDYNVNGTIVTMTAGNGIFVNSKQMHFGFSRQHQDCRFLCLVFRPTLLCVNAAFEEAYVRPIIDNGVPFLALDHGDPYQAAVLATLKTLRDAGQDKLTVQAKLFAIWADLFPTRNPLSSRR